MIDSAKPPPVDPSRSTQARADRVVAALRRGAPLAVAAGTGNISLTTFRRYLRRGEALRVQAIAEGLVDPEACLPALGSGQDNAVSADLIGGGWPKDKVLLVAFAGQV